MSEWVRTNVWTVVERPEYHFQIEEKRNGDNQMIFVHLDVFTWSHNVLKQMLADFAAFRACTDAPLFASAMKDDEKWRRFVALFGFRPLTDALCMDGQTRRIFINVKEQDDEFGHVQTEGNEPVHAGS